MVLLVLPYMKLTSCPPNRTGDLAFCLPRRGEAVVWPTLWLVRTISNWRKVLVVFCVVLFLYKEQTDDVVRYLNTLFRPFF